jgi:hypothetical protein
MEEKLWLAHYSMTLCLASTMRHGIVGLCHRENVSTRTCSTDCSGEALGGHEVDQLSLPVGRSKYTDCKIDIDQSTLKFQKLPTTKFRKKIKGFSADV